MLKKDDDALRALRVPSANGLGDYFLNNAPSQQNGPYQPIDTPYFNGQEEFAANIASILAVLALVVVVGVFLLFVLNPGFHQMLRPG
jgi:hypothetical protein